MSHWTDAYAEHDQSRLAEWAGPGKVRRALKLAAGDAAPATFSESADGSGALIQVAGFAVRLDGGGPSRARCPCPAGGVCVHVVAACLAAHQRAQTAPGAPDRGAPGGIPPAGAGPSGPSRSPTSAHSPDVSTGTTPSAQPAANAPADTSAPAQAGPGATAPGGQPSSGPPGGQPSSGPDTGRPSSGPDTGRPSSGPDTGGAAASGAVDRASAVSSAPGQGAADTADQSSNRAAEWAALPPRAHAAIEDLRAEIEDLVAVGLGRLSTGAAESLADLATSARAAGLPLLARHVARAAGQARKLAQRREDAAQAQMTSALARIWALGEALTMATGSDLARLRGAQRRQFQQLSGALNLHPLGAWQWHSDSGARGITLVAWDTERRQPWTTTLARPSGADLRFLAAGPETMFWGVTLSRLLTGPFELTAPRADADGSLSPTGGQAKMVGHGIGQEVLQEATAALQLARPSPDLAAGGWPVAMLATSGRGKVSVDEPEQRLVWRLATVAGDQARLDQDITPLTGRRVEAVLALEESGAAVAYVLAARGDSRGRETWSPVTVAVREGRALKLTALDWPPQRRRQSLAGRAVDLMLRRWAADPPRAPASRPAAAVLADDVRDLVVQFAAAGRLRTSPGQLARVGELARRADDLALATLAQLLRRLGDQADAPVLLQIHHIADRIAVLAGGASPAIQ